MLRQTAFEHKGTKMLKGALHCHTTRSDGYGAPEEVIRKYAANGYDFMALTDHNIYNHTNFAPETDIIIVPGTETGSGLPDNIDGGIHCFHTVCIGPTVEDGNGYVQDQKIPVKKSADQFEYQKSLDIHHANKNMTFYCHPVWSSTPAREFERLTGNFAMEIWNSYCALAHEMDCNAAYWDELLMQNIKIFGVAVDDGHFMEHHCIGWVSVRAERNLNSILEALRQGAFYSSCGPEIYDFYIDNGIAVVECSPCAAISFHYGRYPTKIYRNETGLIERAEHKASEFYRYMRASVKDEAGRRAWSNPIFIK